MNKNPANSYGETPLLCAVKNCHSDICAYIIDNVDEDKKNPADNNGFTPLHYAAMLNDLKIYKVIAENTSLLKKTMQISAILFLIKLSKKKTSKKWQL